ncbi:hypothetical protein ASPCAL07788 [Aspergillus calidoustus]|uniref:F-box domain-containing protein n=1 Tax=Aspergillus calidoustus TaxID=454130 RepID=A0A0U5GQS1_ASPCI|nr:hypothetical protein ASPCAL07788 [Aspergillus calidoustus]
MDVPILSKNVISTTAMRRRSLPDHQNGRLTLPDKLTAELPQSSSPLLNLPPEILQIILDRTDPQSRLMLALTCKGLLNVLSDQLSPDALIPSTTSGRYEMLRLLHPRVPRTLALSQEWNICRRCERLKPTARAYWTAKPVGERPRSRVARMQRLTWAQVIAEFRQKSVEMCPACIMIKGLPERRSMLDPRRIIER